jgi:hypothetical protein
LIKEVANLNSNNNGDNNKVKKLKSKAIPGTGRGVP